MNAPSNPNAVEPMFTAAGQGRRLKLYNAPLSGPNSFATNGGATILRRARDAQRNDPYAGAATDKYVSNAIGTGIRAKPMWGNDEDRALQAKLWENHMKLVDADFAQDGYGMQATLLREFNVTGECFARFRPRLKKDGFRVPLQVQLISAEQCPAHYYGRSDFGNSIECGVELNGVRRPVAYWMYRAHPGDFHNGTINATQLVRVPAEQILHLYDPQEPGQLRGKPRTISTLVLGWNIKTMSDNMLELMKTASLFSGFYTRDGSTPAPALGVLDGEVVAIDTDGAPIAGIEPGSMQELPPGVGVEFNTPPSPGANYEPFMRTQLLAFAARCGVPYEVLTGDLRDISDRALKLILNEFRRMIEMDQWLRMIPRVLQPWRERWFDEAVLAGALSIPGYADIRDDVTQTLWVPQGWPYSHPVQDVDADIKAVRAGFTSQSAVILSKGNDPDETRTQIVEDNRLNDDGGLVLDSDPRKTSAAGLSQARPTGTQNPDPDVRDDV